MGKFGKRNNVNLDILSYNIMLRQNVANQQRGHEVYGRPGCGTVSRDWHGAWR